MSGTKSGTQQMLLVPCPYPLDMCLFQGWPAQLPRAGMCDSLSKDSLSKDSFQLPELILPEHRADQKLQGINVLPQQPSTNN